MGTPRRPATEAEAKALASAVRLRIIRLCLDRALTNKEIAQRLDANPATTLHHVRTLVDTGFLTAQPVRRGTRGSREVPYLATGKSWTLDVSEHTPAVPDWPMVEAFLAELGLVTSAEEVKMTRLGLRLTQAEYDEVTRRLADLFEELAGRPRTPEGRPYSVFFALHPDVGRDTATGPDAAGPAA